MVDVMADEKDAGSDYVRKNANGDIAMSVVDSLKINDHIDFIKIDVEGFGFEVFKGARQTIAQNRLDIFVEIFDENYDKVNDLLQQTGCTRVFKIEQDYMNKYVFGEMRGAEER